MIDPKMAKEIQDAFGYGLKEISQFNSFCDDHLKIIEYCQNIALNLALCSIYEMQEDDLSVRCPFPKALPFGESGGLGGTHIVLVGGEKCGGFIEIYMKVWAFMFFGKFLGEC